MAIPLPPDPDDQPDEATSSGEGRRRSPGGRRGPPPVPLTAYEQQALESIADDLAVADPDLTARMARRRGTGWGPSPLSVRSLVWLVVGLGVLVLAAKVIPTSGWAVLGLVTVIVIVPWLVLATTGPPRRSCRSCRRGRRPGSGTTPN